MIEFCRGQGSQEPASLENQQAIKDMLLSSFTADLNYQFNNYDHFGSCEAPGNMQGFLQDVHDAFLSERETLQVMGDIHSGAEHYSMLIGQYGPDDTFHPARVLDKYISVRLKPNTRGYMPYDHLYPDVVYHILVDTPQVTFLAYNDTEPVIRMY